MDVEQIGARDPAILNSLLPRSTVLSNPDNDIHTIVAEIETLAMTLRTVADESEGVIFEVFLRLSEGNS